MIFPDTIQNALKNLYYSLGGNADIVRDMDDPNDIINEMAKLDIGGGGGGLPDPSQLSQGEVLTVAEGEGGKQWQGERTYEVVSVAFDNTLQKWVTTYDIGTLSYDKRYIVTIDVLPGIYADSPAALCVLPGSGAYLQFSAPFDLSTRVTTTRDVVYTISLGTMVSEGVYELVADYRNLPFVVTLTPTAQDFSGTMDKTGDEIYQAFLLGRRIRFDVPVLSASMDATMYNIHYDSEGGVDGVIANAFVAFNAGSGWMNILVSSDPYDNTYFTNIFPLTPMS